MSEGLEPNFDFQKEEKKLENQNPLEFFSQEFQEISKVNQNNQDKIKSLLLENKELNNTVLQIMPEFQKIISSQNNLKNLLEKEKDNETISELKELNEKLKQIGKIAKYETILHIPSIYEYIKEKYLYEDITLKPISQHLSELPKQYREYLEGNFLPEILQEKKEIISRIKAIYAEILRCSFVPWWEKNHQGQPKLADEMRETLGLGKIVVPEDKTWDDRYYYPVEWKEGEEKYPQMTDLVEEGLFSEDGEALIKAKVKVSCADGVHNEYQKYAKEDPLVTTVDREKLEIKLKSLTQETIDRQEDHSFQSIDDFLNIYITKILAKEFGKESRESNLAKLLENITKPRKILQSSSQILQEVSELAEQQKLSDDETTMAGTVLNKCKALQDSLGNLTKECLNLGVSPRPISDYLKENLSQQGVTNKENAAVAIDGLIENYKNDFIKSNFKNLPVILDRFIEILNTNFYFFNSELDKMTSWLSKKDDIKIKQSVKILENNQIDLINSLGLEKISKRFINDNTWDERYFRPQKWQNGPDYPRISKIIQEGFTYNDEVISKAQVEVIGDISYQRIS